MKTFLISQLSDAAHLKPPGYFDLCMKTGTIGGDFIYFTEPQIEEIQNHFKAPSVAHVDCKCGEIPVCEFLTEGSCALSFYEGKPKRHECRRCIAAGENTEEFGLLFLAQLSNSPQSGCRGCSSAK
jgi:hypothetical protein